MSNLPRVYFASARAEKYTYRYSQMAKLEKVFKRMGPSSYFAPKEVVLIKLHMGNPGCNQTVRPSYVAQVVRILKEIEVRPVVTDSQRIHPYTYLTIANEIGYNPLTLGAPVVIADGIFGKDSVKVKAGRHLGEIHVASAIYDTSAMVVLTHAKGHLLAGYAGALKHVSMGGTAQTPREGGWKMGRGKMHADWKEQSAIQWNESLCTFCASCVQVCPFEYVSIEDKEIVINHEFCVRCSRCVRVCESGALTTTASFEYFIETVAEGAKAVIDTFSEKKIIYVNFLHDIQPECDCVFAADTAVLPNLGIMISDDPVAIDTATLDMMATQKPLPYSKAQGLEVPPGKDLFSVLHEVDARALIHECEALGLGETRYELVEVH